MSDNPLSLSLNPVLKERLKRFQHKNRFATPDEAVMSILEDFFSIEDAKHASTRTGAVNPEITMTVSPEQQAALLAEQSGQDAQNQKALDDKVSVLTRQLIQLQQQLTDQYDQLRGQVAAIHLSHSGLIKNLRERVETLEEPPAKS